MISRTRKHPRVRSVSWRTFDWLITRVAVAHICGNVNPGLPGLALHNWIARSQTSSVRRLGLRLLRQEPAARFWP